MTTTRRHASIRDMWRMYKLLQFLYKFPSRKDLPNGGYYTYTIGGVYEDELNSYLVANKFLEPKREILWSILKYIKIYNHQSTPEQRLSKEKDRHRQIGLTIKDCFEKGYLESPDESSNKRLHLTGKGARFCRNLYEYSSEYLKEHSGMKIFIGTIIGSLFGVEVLKFIWDLIKLHV